MYEIIREAPNISHSGVQGMKWGYNDGKRNGRRTAKELNDLKEVQKRTPGVDVSTNIEKDYAQADHMLRFLGITLDAHSNDEAVVRSMAIYKQMADTKDRYKNQYDWLKTFSRRLSTIGYDMKAVDEMIDKNKSTFQSIKSGGGADADVGEKSSTADLMTSYKRNKSKREAIKKHDKSVSKSKKKDEEKDNNKEGTSEVENEITDDEKKKKSVKHSAIQNEVYIEHHGILGQKWGVRRFQNKDGSLTSEGKKRYSNMSDSELQDAVSRKRLENRYKELKTGRGTHIHKSVEEATGKSGQLAKAKFGDKNSKTKTVNAAGNVAKDAAKIVDKASEAKIKSDRRKIDTSDLSKEDLQKAIKRMELEQEYDKLSKDDVERGKIITTDVLQNIGLVASTAVDVATFAILMKTVLKK